MQNNCKNAAFSTICLMIFRELKVEKSIHQGFIAKELGVALSTLSKIENGSSRLSFDSFCGLCKSVGIPTWHFFRLFDGVIGQLTWNGFYFHAGGLDKGEDDLLALVLDYYDSSGYHQLIKHKSWVSIASYAEPNYGFKFREQPSIVRYCCDKSFREWVRKGCIGAPPTSFT